MEPGRPIFFEIDIGTNFRSYYIVILCIIVSSHVKFWELALFTVKSEYLHSRLCVKILQLHEVL